MLLSNSTNPGEPYLGWPEMHIKDFLGEKVRNILFVPYAGVTISYDDYYAVVSRQLSRYGYEVECLHKLTFDRDPTPKFDAIAIGGGNTFRLAQLLQQKDLFEPLRTAVLSGKPLIGWSAGSNITCPTIMTTNDMPVVEPASFNGLNLVPFQINPHYTEATIPNHGGESRNMRLMEFTELNQKKYVVGLPEGSLLRLERNQLFFIGKGKCKIFHHGKEPQTYKDGDDLSWLLSGN